MEKLMVISGGTKGIGRATLYRFLAEGFDVATCSRSQKDLLDLEKEVAVDFPARKIFTCETDVSLKEQCYQFISFVKELDHPVEVLVNNAGIFIPGQIHQEEDEVLETMLRTNLFSSYYFAKAFSKMMKENRKGHIFNICSTASITAYVNGGSYCISKYAQYGMSKVLREEMKEHQVKVTAVLPGATYTASWESSDLPPERFMKAEDVAEAIFNAYKLSDRSVVEDLIIRPQLGDLG